MMAASDKVTGATTAAVPPSLMIWVKAPVNTSTTMVMSMKLGSLPKLRMPWASQSAAPVSRNA